MINPFSTGDIHKFVRVVREEDQARFESGEVHPVYSTFALGRDAEWACRLFVLEMKEEDEEGIGTFLEIRHRSPALIGDKVEIEARLESVEGHEVICSFRASIGARLVAEGRTGQKILKKNKVASLFRDLKE